MSAVYVPPVTKKELEDGERLKSGLYRYEHDCPYNRGEIVIKLTNTANSYKMELVKNTIQFTPAQIEMLFKSGKAIVPKRKSPHSMRFSGDEWFCIYPYRDGVPFPFRYAEKTGQMELF